MNVLLLVLDTARRDAFTPYGAAGDPTPAIAELARRGTAVEHAYATANWTLPSHASMFTGELPRALGLTQPPGGTVAGARPAFEAARARMLGTVLRGAGYETRGWSSNVWASSAAGLDVGFDRFEFVTGGRDEQMNALLSGGPRAELAWALQGLRARTDDGAAAIGRGLRAAIAAWNGRPAFWFVNLCECHSPYLPPRPWNDLGARERIRAALDNRAYLTFKSIVLYASGRGEVPDEAMARFRHLYGRAIASMDAWLAGILEALDARGILEETLVIVTSDHGENFGEAGLIAHGFDLNDELVRVPLVVAGAGVTPPPGGAFSLAGLPWLICEAAGITGHPYAQPGPIAVAQSDPMATIDDPRSETFRKLFDIDDAGIARICARTTLATDGTARLLERDGTSEGDAGVGALRDAIAAARVTAVPPASGPAATDPDELAAIERQMKLLGYM